MDVKIGLAARKKRNSCGFYRYDFGDKVFNEAVCGRLGFKVPSLEVCHRCAKHTDTVPDGRSSENHRQRFITQTIKKWSNENPTLVKECSVCGAIFETKDPVRDRCHGVCRNNLNDFLASAGAMG